MVCCNTVTIVLLVTRVAFSCAEKQSLTGFLQIGHPNLMRKKQNPVSETINAYKDHDWQGQAAGEPTPAANKASKSWIREERLSPCLLGWAVPLQPIIISLTVPKSMHRKQDSTSTGPRHAWRINSSCINFLSFLFSLTFCHKAHGKPQEKNLKTAILSLRLNPVSGVSATVLHFHTIHVAWMFHDMEKPSMSERQLFPHAKS